MNGAAQHRQSAAGQAQHAVRGQVRRRTHIHLAPLYGLVLLAGSTGPFC
eukprot:SAG25_NODE_2964_length_1292_cov_1.723386_3_plen_48_part_01